MDLAKFLLMRHELLLIAVMLVFIVLEMFMPANRKKSIAPIAVGLFSLVTIIGFLPLEHTSLFGGMYHTNGLIITMKNILNIGVLIVFIQGVAWIKRDEHHGKLSEFFILIVSTLIGMNYMISSGDFLMFYLGLELATIPLAALVAFETYRYSSSEAGIKFILLASLSSGISLFGISMLYGISGTVYFTEFSFGNHPVEVLGFVFFFAGLAFKISAVPFHLWTADVYEGAPASVASYLSVISKGAAAFILAILLFHLFGRMKETWDIMIYVIAALTMTIGNLFALRQNNLKRFLAFSSIAQAGFILLGMVGGTAQGMAAVVYFVLVYIFSNLGAFGVIIAVGNASGKETISDYNGMYKTNPKLSLVMMLSLFSLAGIPPLAGFFGKFFLFKSAMDSGFIWLTLIATINATISLYYYLLVVKAMFINKSDHPIPYFKNDGFTRFGLAICTAGLLVIGFTSYIYDYIFSVI
jgi:NADH-quinone oxidoreductase subunit N